MLRTPAKASPDAAARKHAASRPWRIAFIIYAIALTIGTHIPRLQLGPEVPATDKTIHLASFGGLTLLLWRTGWLRHIWLVGAIVLLWSGLDELSQGIPGLNRTVSWQDMVANGAGVIAVATLIWSFGPVGGEANRMRLRLHRFVFDTLFAHRKAWIAAGMGAAAGLAPLLALWPVLDVDGKRALLVFAMFIAGIATSILWFTQWRNLYRLTIDNRLCPACGTPNRTTPVNDDGLLKCCGCGELLSAAQWVEPAAPPLRAQLAMSRNPALLGMGVIVGAFSFLLAIPFVYELVVGSNTAVSRTAPRIARLVGTLPPELVNAIDLALFLLLLAVMIRMYRGNLARYYDQHITCRRCGHDLRGTPTSHAGVGQCGECGTPFLRPAIPQPVETAEQRNMHEHDERKVNDTAAN